MFRLVEMFTLFSCACAWRYSEIRCSSWVLRYFSRLLTFSSVLLMSSFNLNRQPWKHPHIYILRFNVSHYYAYSIFFLNICDGLMTLASCKDVVMPSWCWCIWSRWILQSWHTYTSQSEPLHHHRDDILWLIVEVFETLLSVRMETLSCGRTRSTSRFHSAASTSDSRTTAGLDPPSSWTHISTRCL